MKLEYNGSNRGAVAGCLLHSNTIENIEVSGSVDRQSLRGRYRRSHPYLNAGNPRTSSSFKNCVNNTTNFRESKGRGIVGYARADVAAVRFASSKAAPTMASFPGQYAGGIAGWSYNAELTSCANTAKVSGTTSAGG